MITLDDIRDKLKDRNLSAVAQIVGIDKMTLYRVTNGNMSINYRTYEKLVNYLYPEECKNESVKA